MDIDESIPAILDRGMKWKERFPRLCRLECIYCPICENALSTLKHKSGTSSTKSNIRCKRCQRITKSGSWLCSCRTTWPKCEIHRRTEPTRQLQSGRSRKAMLVRTFGTNKPLPKGRTRPGELQLSEQALRKCTKFVGEGNNAQCEPRPHIVTSPKWPDSYASHVSQPDSEPVNVQPTSGENHDVLFIGEREMVSESHKRQLDTPYPLHLERPHTRIRINLPIGSKLAQRFPQHAQCNTAAGFSSVSDARNSELTEPAQAESNKRRRILPFNMKGSASGQCTEVGPS